MKRRKRDILKWNLSIIPTIHTKTAKITTFIIYSPRKKNLKIRNFLPDQFKESNNSDFLVEKLYLMIVGLKKSVPLVVRALPETSVTGKYIILSTRFLIMRRD